MTLNFLGIFSAALIVLCTGARANEPCSSVQQERTRLLVAFKQQPEKFPLCAETQNAALRAAGLPEGLAETGLRLELLDHGIINPEAPLGGDISFYPQFLRDMKAAVPSDSAKVIAYLNGFQFYAQEIGSGIPGDVSVERSGAFQILSDAEGKLVYAQYNHLLKPGQDMLFFFWQAVSENSDRITHKQRLVYDGTLAKVDPSSLPLDQNQMLRKTPAANTPEADWYQLAQQASLLRAWDSRLTGFSPTEVSRIRTIADAYDLTLSDLYSGENAWALKIPFVRSVQPVASTVDEQIHSDDPLSSAGGVAGEGFWWMNSKGLALISGLTSLSPLGQEFGPDYFRILFWPIAGPLLGGSNGSDKPVPELDQLRVSGISKGESYASRDFTGVEVLGKDDDGDWHAFVYQRIWGLWFPAKTFGKAQTPVRQACLQCHVVAGTGALTPFPNNLHSISDFKKVGYSDDTLIQGLMDPRNN